MDIAPINLNPISLTKVAGSTGSSEKVSPQKNALESFSSVLNNSINSVNDLQVNADTAIQQFVAGKLDIHDVMVEVEKASVAMQLTVQLRNKVLEAYQEVMRMQV
jgi:flagellar hook-basal body complex protein FliE